MSSQEKSPLEEKYEHLISEATTELQVLKLIARLMIHFLFK